MNKKPTKKIVTVDKKHHPQSQEKLKRILMSPFYQLVVKMARNKKGEELNKYINDVRRRFDLPLYWVDIIRFSLDDPKYDLSKSLAGLCNIIPLKDNIIHKKYYCLAVYPGTTQRDVIRAFSRISKIYRGKNYNKRMRFSKRFDLEMLALLLRKYGKSYKYIASKLSDRSGKEIDEYSVCDYIKSAEKKLGALSSV